MNPDFGIIFNFNVNEQANPAELVKTVRDVGARAISISNASNLAPYQAACDEYTIQLVEVSGEELASENVIDKIVHCRKNNQAAIFDLTLEADGDIKPEQKTALTIINDWMHWFGHALNEGEASSLTTSGDSFALQNRHAPYQIYVFIKSPLPTSVTVGNFELEPTRIEWIDERNPLNYQFEHHQITVNLSPFPEGMTYPWRVLRILKHRPEDDIKETKF